MLDSAQHLQGRLGCREPFVQHFRQEAYPVALSMRFAWAVVLPESMRVLSRMVRMLGTPFVSVTAVAKQRQKAMGGRWQGSPTSCANQLTSRWTFQEAAVSRRPKRQAVIVAGVHLAISSKVFCPGEMACLETSQQSRRRWRPRHTLGMPRNTIVTKAGGEVKAIIMSRAVSRGGPERKAGLLENSHACLYTLQMLICKGLAV